MQAIVFPGQGSQYIGMGKDFYDNFIVAKHVFQIVDEALGVKLSDIIFNDSIKKLNLTCNTQPAIMTVSIAIAQVLKCEFGWDFLSHNNLLAGHSLGEYSALCAANVFDLVDTAKMLKARGEAMQKAVPLGQGGMLALLGSTIVEAQQLIQAVNNKHHICEIANDNCIGQVVISGHMQALHKAIDLAKQYNIKRAILLPVSAPFHSSLMQKAANDMDVYFNKNIKNIKAPQVPIVTNVRALPISKAKDIIPNLVQQITHPVRWVDSIKYMHNKGCKKFIEIGPKKVLCGLIKKIVPDNVQIHSLETIQDLQKIPN